MDHYPTNFIHILMTYAMHLQKHIWTIFRTTPHGCRRILIQKLSLRNRHLINPNVGDWYDHILTTKLWDYREFRTCRMWVVWIFVFFSSQINFKISLLREEKI